MTKGTGHIRQARCSLIHILQVDGLYLGEVKFDGLEKMEILWTNKHI